MTAFSSFASFDVFSNSNSPLSSLQSSMISIPWHTSFSSLSSFSGPGGVFV